MTGLTARGVGLYLDIRADQLNYMLNKGVLLDMGAWIQTSASIDVTLRPTDLPHGRSGLRT